MKPKLLWISALIGLVLFIVVQVLPMTRSDSPDASSSVSKKQAIMNAIKFAEQHLGFSELTEAQASVTYTSYSDTYGYLSKMNLLDEYNKKYVKQFPTERFKVQFKHPDSHLENLYIEVNMRDGNIVGFDAGELWSTDLKNELLKSTEGTSKVKDLEGDLSFDEKEQLVAPYITALGFEQSQLVADSSDQTGLIYRVKGFTEGKAQGELIFQFEYNKVSSVESHFTVPQSHLDYVKGQTKLATWLTFVGYGLFSLILGILAIVYSARTKAYTSFRRGIFLTLFYLFINIVSTVNMMPVFEAQGLSGTAFIMALVFQGLTVVVMTVSLYFSLVGGDGLWREQRMNQWLRAGEENYGPYVLRSALDGYAWAFILLGIQSIIYILLGVTIHTWSTTDDTQSPYNMLYPWLFPIMAWMAGIGEEAVYRLFGIPMLKKIFRSTFVACLISTWIWAFGHTLYPIYPVISRPIELTFIGLLFCYIFLRSGYIGSMFAHVVFDSLLMGLSLLLMGGTLNITIAIVTFIMPALVGYIISLFNPPGQRKLSPASISGYDNREPRPW